MATSFESVRNYSMSIRERRPFDANFYSDKVEKDLRRLSSIWEELREKAAAKGGDEGYLFGRFTAIDAMYAPVMFRLRSYDLASKIEGKHAKAYVQHILNNEYVKEWENMALQETEVIPRGEPYPLK